MNCLRAGYLKMHNPPRKPVTAAQEILLGAFDLAENQYDEFSEWDLTISTWKRNPNRFGCRGYEDEYPDHKRVMMEIMGTTKKDNPLRRGVVRKNTTQYLSSYIIGEIRGRTACRTWKYRRGNNAFAASGL